MSEKKYELIYEDRIELDYHRTVYRIRAVRDFDNVKAGDLGGYVMSYYNLSHDGGCWIYDNAIVYDYASISDDAEVCGNARVYDSAEVYGRASICDNARVYNSSEVTDKSKVSGHAKVYGDARVCDRSSIYEYARVHDKATIYDNAIICNNADISSNNDYLFIRGLGSENRYTTAFRLPNGIYVKCGCFGGILSQFESKVNDTHGDNKYGREYKSYIRVIRDHFNLS